MSGRPAASAAIAANPDLHQGVIPALSYWRLSFASASLEHRTTRSFKLTSPRFLRNEAALLEVDHTHDHRPLRIEGQVLEAPMSIKLANPIIKRLRQNSKAGDIVRSPQCRRQRKQKERTRVTLSLIAFVDRELSEQRCRYALRLVALVRFGKERALDLSGAQRHVADDEFRVRVTDDAHAGDARDMIVPGMTSEPFIQSLAPAVEATALIIFGKRSRRRYLRHVGGLRASSLSPAIARAGRAAHASNRS